MEIALEVIFSIAFAVAVLSLFRLNEVSLTKRGARLVLILALIAGAFLATAATHLFYSCDSNNKCGYTWGNPDFKVSK